MSLLDPFGLKKFHDKVAKKIEDGKAGYAQSSIGNLRVSYVLGSGITGTTSPNLSGVEALEQIIVDVAQLMGRASKKTFSRNRVMAMIEDREAMPTSFSRLRQEARDMRAFYLDGGPGANKLY